MTVRTTVIIPMHDASATIERAVRSVLAQDDADWELIVVDDGSADRSSEIVGSIVDPRIRLVRHEGNRGISAARNTGLAAAGGEFLAFLDADDAWEPDFLRRMHAIRGVADAVVCGRTVVLPDGAERTAHSSRLGVMTGDLAAERMMTGELTPFPWDKLVRRSAFSGVRYPEDVRRFEDQVVGVVVMSRLREVVSAADPLVRYHVAAGSLTWGRVPRLAETESALTYLESALGEWLHLSPSRGSSYVACRTLFFMLTAQSAMRGQDRAAAGEVLNGCRRAITGRMVATTLRRAPVVGAGALLLKCLPQLYRRLFTAYVRRQYALV